ncbi:discoidin domain-containing protein [Paenibacillus peoriae]|uniref:Discoidin domain-containing protein n=1 Tax=Paenibacillus peoriae TaxID=59893 RepID=A0A7H0Y396_9BACL|nr:discoidin domain-containing protein [Paenibacillus peoriae]QNR65554.1 discoidin domain-containing protein [Paenibacillus peoriae]
MANYSENLIPTMTSNTTPSGITSASTEYGDRWKAWNAFDHLVDDYGWVAASGNTTGWLCYKFPSSIRITRYTITMRSGSHAESPNTWTFEASSDGAAWSVLDTRSNISFSTNLSQSFDFTNGAPYSYYRINITKNNGGGLLRISDMEMYTKQYENKFLITTDTSETYSIHKKVGRPLVPPMNGLDSVSGSVIGSSSYSEGYTWKAFDGDDTTFYNTNFIPDIYKPVFIGFKFNEPVCVKRYSFLAALRTFKLMASNDGANWVVLDTKTAIPLNSSTLQTFDVQNDNLYIYYKIESSFVLAGNGWVNIYSVQFYGLFPPVLVNCPLTEQSFVQNGMDRGYLIDTNEEMNVRQYIKQDSVALGSGKVFRHPVNTAKVQIKGVTIR